jgi:hypothetical protein
MDEIAEYEAAATLAPSTSESWNYGKKILEKYATYITVTSFHKLKYQHGARAKLFFSSMLQSDKYWKLELRERILAQKYDMIYLTAIG